MIRRLLIHDFLPGVIRPVCGVLALLVMLLCNTPLQQKISPDISRILFCLSLVWVVATDWKELIAWNGWKNIESEELLFKHILRRNTTHLSMSANTPLANGPLAEAIGLDGNLDFVDDILEGLAYHHQLTDHLPSDEIENSPELHAFLSALQKPCSTLTGASIPEISPSLSLDEYKSLFNNTKETTASYPPLHYGHFKAACESDILATVNLMFMNTPFQHGIPLDRWSNSYHCMIQKKALPYINKLRIVQLYCADFNSYLKYIIGRRLMRHSEKHGVTNDQLYAKKGSSAKDALLTTRLIFDNSRLSRDNMVFILNDLKGNYDRVRPACNTITTRRIGLPKGPAVCHAMALRLMKHYIRTGYGISELYILWSITQNLGGIGQGNGAGPISRHTHMLPLIEAYEELVGESVKITNPDQTVMFEKWLIGYVDDNSIFASIDEPDFCPNAAAKLIKIAKTCLEVWQKLIHTTGGELEIEKSCLSIMSWQQQHGREVLAPIAASPGDMCISSVKYPGLQVQLDRNEPSKGERLLGVRLALDGNDKDEYRYRLSQSTELSGKIMSSPLSRVDAEVIYRERWLSSVGYCLPITQLSDTECDEIQIPFFQAILPKMGLNRHIPKAVRFGPTKYNGKGLGDFSTEQYILHLEQFIGALRKRQELGDLFRIVMDKYQQLIGSEKHFLTLDPSVYSYGESSFMQYLWTKSFDTGTKIILSKAWTLPPYRAGDRYIMDEFVCKVKKSYVLQRLNDVRIYLRVTRLSDICNTEGNRLDFSILHGRRRPAYGHTWLKRRKPLEENLKKFREVIISIFKGTPGLFPHDLGPVITTPTPPVPHGNFNQLLQLLPNHHRVLLGNFHLRPRETNNILQWLKAGTIYFGSDGSVANHLGAHGFGVTHGEQRTIIYGGSAPTPGNRTEITSLRTELAGAICVVLLISLLEKRFNSCFPPISIWIDNTETIRRAQEDPTTWRDMFALDYDLWREL